LDFKGSPFLRLEHFVAFPSWIVNFVPRSTPATGVAFWNPSTPCFLRLPNSPCRILLIGPCVCGPRPFPFAGHIRLFPATLLLPRFKFSFTRVLVFFQFMAFRPTRRYFLSSPLFFCLFPSSCFSIFLSLGIFRSSTPPPFGIV